MDRYIVLSSDDKSHANNSPSQFTVRLPTFSVTDCEIALTQLICFNLSKGEMVYVTCNLVKPALMVGALPLLRVTTVRSLRKRSSITTPYYIPVLCDRIQEITLRLLSSPNQLVSFQPEGGQTVAVLHLRQRYGSSMPCASR
jgi:hypothetical protein